MREVLENCSSHWTLSEITTNAVAEVERFRGSKNIIPLTSPFPHIYPTLQRTTGAVSEPESRVRGRPSATADNVTKETTATGLLEIPSRNSKECFSDFIADFTVHPFREYMSVHFSNRKKRAILGIYEMPLEYFVLCNRKTMIFLMTFIRFWPIVSAATIR